MVMEEEEESVKQFMTPTWPTTTMAAAAAAAAAASKLCDSCKSSTATLFCRADSAFLCIPCDSKIHAANKLASRHARVWMCEVCEQAPAHVTCKADAAALCVTCDRDIHSANPLARRHHRFPVVPFFDSVAAGEVGKETSVNLNDVVDGVGEDEEAEAASWLIPNPNTGKIGYDMYSDMDPYLDLEYGTMDAKFQLKQDLNQQNYSPSAAAAASINCDGVVPVAQSKNVHGSFVNGGSSDSCFDMDILGSKAFSFYNNNNGQSLSQTVSSSSLDVGVVPDGTAMIDVSNPFGRQFNNISDSPNQAAQLSGVDREARVLRYREKRKNRKFEKTIRYASRKAYAETRPRIKGRFAKRTEMDAEVDQIYGVSPALIAVDTGYGVVPTF